MITIRKNQTSRLQQPLIADFVEQAIEFTKTNYPQHFEDIKEEGVRELAVKAVDDAATYKITLSTNILGLFSLMLIFGADFAKQQKRLWMRQILENPMIPPSEKVPMILEDLANG